MLGCNSWSPCTWEQLRPGQQSGQYWVPQREYWVPHWPPPRWRLWPSDKQRRSSASKVIPLTTLTTLESARSTSSYKLWSSLLSDRVLTQVPRLTLTITIIHTAFPATSIQTAQLHVLVIRLSSRVWWKMVECDGLTQLLYYWPLDCLLNALDTEISANWECIPVTTWDNLFICQKISNNAFLIVKHEITWTQSACSQQIQHYSVSIQRSLLTKS